MLTTFSPCISPAARQRKDIKFRRMSQGDGNIRRRNMSDRKGSYHISE